MGRESDHARTGGRHLNPGRLVVGTVDEELARAHTAAAVAALATELPHLAVSVNVLGRGEHHAGSRPGGGPAPRSAARSGGAGRTRLTLDALLAGEVDALVLRAKDQLPQLPAGCAIGAYLRRNTPFDVLVSVGAETLDELPPGSRVLLQSLRRRGQLAGYRMDLDLVEARGSLDEWRRELDSGRCRGMVLAADTVERLGMQELVGEILSPGVCLPAPGQGALVVIIRSEAKEVVRLLRAVSDRGTEAEVTAEMAVLQGLGVDSAVAVGALARVSGSSLSLDAVVVGREEGDMARLQAEGDLTSAPELGQELAERLLALGADDLLRGVRRAPGRSKGRPTVEN